MALCVGIHHAGILGLGGFRVSEGYSVGPCKFKVFPCLLGLKLYIGEGGRLQSGAVGMHVSICVCWDGGRYGW